MSIFQRCLLLNLSNDPVKYELYLLCDLCIILHTHDSFRRGPLDIQGFLATHNGW